MNKKTTMALILAFLAVVAVSYYLKVFAQGSLYYAQDKEDCEWCDAFFVPSGNYMGYEGCLIPDEEQAWCFWVQVQSLTEPP